MQEDPFFKTLIAMQWETSYKLENKNLFDESEFEDSNVLQVIGPALLISI